MHLIKLGLDLRTRQSLEAISLQIRGFHQLVNILTSIEFIY